MHTPTPISISELVFRTAFVFTLGNNASSTTDSRIGALGVLRYVIEAYFRHLDWIMDFLFTLQEAVETCCLDVVARPLFCSVRSGRKVAG